VPAYNPYVGSWPFLGEEGEMLEWAQRVLDGQVYGRDFFCLYGPLMIYALAGSLAVFGESVVVERACTFALNALAHGVVLVFLARNLRSHALLVACALVYALCFNMLTFFSPNTTLLRGVLGLAPLFLLTGSAREQGPLAWTIAGGLTGLSLLFSQEAGLCAVVSLAGVGVFDAASGSGVRVLLRRAAGFGAGLACVLLPFVLWMASQGALVAVLESLYGYPRLMTLGFGGIPFTSLRDFLADPLGSRALLAYAILAVYVVSILSVATAFARGDRSRRTRLLFALTLFGLLLFRGALGRSDAGNVVKASTPAFLLCFLHLDAALAALQSARSAFLRRWAALRLAGFAVSLALVVGFASELQAMIPHATRGLLDPGGKLSLGTRGVSLPELPRVGVRVHQDTAATMRVIHAFLEASTRAGDYVYFFPNEAIYYFVFDRRNPTRFAIAYFAITSELRRELVADLERRKPRFVVWSMRTWRVDGILEHIQVPEVLAYLKQRYRLHSQLDGALILERIDP
jgi:hypothetical protein